MCLSSVISFLAVNVPSFLGFCRDLELELCHIFFDVITLCSFEFDSDKASQFYRAALL